MVGGLKMSNQMMDKLTDEIKGEKNPRNLIPCWKKVIPETNLCVNKKWGIVNPFYSFFLTEF